MSACTRSGMAVAISRLVWQCGPAAPASASLASLEREHIQRVLQQVGGNKQAAAILGLSRRALYRRLHRY